MTTRDAPRAVLLDLLMATMNSIATWSTAAGNPVAGLRWRDEVTARMVAAGRYVPYEGLVTAAAEALDLPPAALERLWNAWQRMSPWPDATAIERLQPAYAFVTNTSMRLAHVAVERSGLHPAFTLSAEEAGWYKPHHPVYDMARHALGAAEVMYVAGAAYDAIGAHRAGLASVLVARRRVTDLVPPEVRVAASLDDALDGLFQ